jgi:hypothetical protein
MYRLGWKQFTPFVVTVLGIVFTDLIDWNRIGTCSWGCGDFDQRVFRIHISLHIEDQSNGVHKIKMTLAEEVTFFNKGAILKRIR